MLLYVHLPFCSSRCAYCDFYSTVPHDSATIYTYIDMLAQEWKIRTSGRRLCAIDTVFIGGGTPSYLTMKQWHYLEQMLFSLCSIEKGAEWTIECNPESISDEKTEYFASIGVTRVTFGIQSLDMRERRVLKRNHSIEQIEQVLSGSALQRFASVGVDVMYGIPGQQVDSFQRTLHTVLQYSVINHLSAYELYIADGTPFGRHRRLLPLPHEEQRIEMNEVLLSMTNTYGFRQYEVSNFARPGHECRHNIGYWTHQPYIGLGASAHSFMDGKRMWNISDVQQYCSLLEQGILPIEKEETVDSDILAKEMLFLGFRQTCGLNEIEFKVGTGMEFIIWADSSKLRKFLVEKYLIYCPPYWCPTLKGLMNADYIARELI